MARTRSSPHTRRSTVATSTRRWTRSPRTRNGTRARSFPDTGVYRGREAIRAFLTDFLGSWERFHQTIEEVRQEGDRVLVMIHLEATGRGSTADVDARYAHLWTVSGTRGIRVDAFYDRAEALAALNP